ncbi:MAG: ketopantoate reductase C-terminal domain-containing protein [Hyphomicrobiales bacterium]
MRIERGEHAIDGGLDHLLLVGLLDIIGAHPVEHVAEQVQLLVGIGIRCRPGRAKGVPFPTDYADKQLMFADTTPPGFKASMLHDLERGNRLELDWLAGKVVALGRETGVATPANAAVYAMLKLHRMGAGANAPA